MVVPVLLGSVRSERLGDRAARWVIEQLAARGHDAVLVDALELPLLDKMWKEIKPGPRRRSMRRCMRSWTAGGVV